MSTCIMEGCGQPGQTRRAYEPHITASDFCRHHGTCAGVPCKVCGRWSPSVSCAYKKVGRCEVSV